jgi:hypothetical protein
LLLLLLLLLLALLLLLLLLPYSAATTLASVSQQWQRSNSSYTWMDFYSSLTVTGDATCSGTAATLLDLWISTCTELSTAQHMKGLAAARQALYSRQRSAVLALQHIHDL